VLFSVDVIYLTHFSGEDYYVYPTMSEKAINEGVSKVSGTSSNSDDGHSV
jgi:hypothetical protein